MTTYMDRPWLKCYDEGVPPSLGPYPNIALHDLLRQGVQEHPAREVLITTVRLPLVGRKTSALTYRQLDRASDALASALVKMGVRKGDRVAVVMGNFAAFAIVYYGILKAGGVVAAANPTYPPPKMAYQINDCDAEVVICMSLFYDMIKQIQPETKLKTVIVTNVKEYFPPLAKFLFTVAREKKEGHRVEKLADGDFWLQDLLQRYDGQKPNVEVTGDDLALIQYTGGTTGVSKGAVSTHRALVANVEQLKAWVAPLNQDYSQELAVGALPLFHVYGMVALLSRAISSGSRIVLVPDARNIDDVVDIIDHHKPTTFAGVPQLFNAIANHPRIKSGEASLSSLQIVSSGSAPLPPAVKTEFEKMLGSGMSEGFGMSECPTVTHWHPTVGEKRAGSIGIPLPDVIVRIVSLDDGETDLPIGEIGEMVISSPNLMKGYHKMPTETANALRQKDGRIWLSTGDIAYMDQDGYFYIVDRKKDMVLIGGFNVYPTQIEKVLKEHPAVSEVGVAGIAHPEKEGQEALKAWVVLKPGMEATEEELRAHCERSLAPYEVPRRFAFVPELPKSAVGKTLRRELIRMEAEGRSY